MNDDPPFEMVFDGPHARAFCFNPAASKLWVRFNARQTATMGFPAPEPQKAALAAGYASMWVQTRDNDYYLNDDLLDLRRALNDFTARFQHVGAVGFSMGGFGAVLLSRALRMRQAVLVSPQRLGFPLTHPFLSDPEVERLAYHQGGDPALDGVSPDLRGMVLFDPFAGRGRDKTYARHLEQIAPGLTFVPLVGGGHPATNVLHQAKNFGQFQTEVLRVQPDPKAVRRIHRKSRRNSERYLVILATYLEQRRHRVRQKK